MRCSGSVLYRLGFAWGWRDRPVATYWSRCVRYMRTSVAATQAHEIRRIPPIRAGRRYQ